MRSLTGSVLTRAYSVHIIAAPSGAAGNIKLAGRADIMSMSYGAATTTAPRHYTTQGAISQCNGELIRRIHRACFTRVHSRCLENQYTKE